MSDGETVIATRFRNGKNEVPPSLYYHLGPMPGEQDWCAPSTAALRGLLTMQSLSLLHRAGARAESSPPRPSPALPSHSRQGPHECRRHGRQHPERGYV